MLSIERVTLTHNRGTITEVTALRDLSLEIGHGEFVTRSAEMAPAAVRALKSGRPACVNVMLDGLAAPSFSRG